MIRRLAALFIVVACLFAFVGTHSDAFWQSRAQVSVSGGGGSTTTWNPSDKAAGITLSNGNLTATATATANQTGRATTSKTTGQWYWEVTATVATSTSIGVANASALLSNFLGQDGNAYGYFNGNGQVLLSGAAAATLATYTSGDIISIALDMTNSKIWFRKNAGGWNNDILANQNPATNTGGLSTTTITPGAVALFPAMDPGATNDAMTANFGGSAFVGSMPAGFSALP